MGVGNGMAYRLGCLTAVMAAFLEPAVALGAGPGGAFELAGQGVQIYGCVAAGGGAAWKLKAPEARLLDAGGHVVGRHFAGPSWQAADGSKVVGAPLVASAAPEGDAIPWLVVRATEHEGTGLFSGVTFITRTGTVGGRAPATGCDAGHVGAETRVRYSARYSFFTPAAD